MWVDGRLRQATHIAWFLQTGVWPRLSMLHRCDTPSCVRYDHLFQGTHADNMRDAAEKGRLSAPRPKSQGQNHYVNRRKIDMSGESSPSALLTKAEVDAIRARYQRRHPVHGGRAMAKEYGVSEGAINKIVTGKNWHD